MNQKHIQKNTSVKNNEEKSLSNSMDSLMEIKISKNNTPKEKNKNISNKKNIINPKIKKRHRRGKFLSDTRDFKCPECLKTYLSSSALKNHRRMKHSIGKEIEKKGRGRPKKEFYEEEYVNQMEKKYNQFIEEKKKITKTKIDFGIIKEVFEKMFIEYKSELFGSEENIEKNTFYSLLKENWEKENPNLDKQSYSSMINCLPAVAIVNKPPIDCIFFQYLKYVSNIFKEDYILFILKFIIIFRQYINMDKKRSINNEYITQNKKEYTQLYDSSVIPDFFNDFLVDFMENRNYFLLDKDIVVEFIEYFCFWVFQNGYTDSHITKIEQ